MARYTGPVCRLCRRDGTKLFLKGAKCFSDKCPIEKRNFPPGQHGQSRKVKKVVGYGLQLREKQKAKRIYFTLETQFRAYYQKAANKTGVTGELLLQQLETRLDNVCYRLGFAMSRRQARQVVRHGHIQVNGRKVNIPSFQCKVGDEIADPRGLEEAGGSRRGEELRQRSACRCSGSTSTATICRARCIALPKREDVNLPVNEQLIVELYSK
jgi:small subunit ribosomal protein S4